MVAGGTGITPMYQLIRAICENDTDTTEVSLIYANRSEADILLREELERFARQYPKNFKLWYLLDSAPEGWTYGTGYVDQNVLTAQLPAPSPDTKMMLCGPPGMVNATKKNLVAMGFEKPGVVSKMTDQIFCF
jgi:cytochrome-b5 reductase